MTDEELIARLRDTADHARFEPHLHHAAADLIEEYGRAYTHLLREFDKRGDRIEALVKENTALKEHVADMLAEQECGCGYDNPTDVCLGHLPLHRKTVARAEQLAATNEQLEAALRETTQVLRQCTFPYIRVKGQYLDREEVVSRADAALKGADHE